MICDCWWSRTVNGTVNHAFSRQPCAIVHQDNESSWPFSGRLGAAWEPRSVLELERWRNSIYHSCRIESWFYLHGLWSMVVQGLDWIHTVFGSFSFSRDEPRRVDSRRVLVYFVLLYPGLHVTRASGFIIWELEISLLRLLFGVLHWDWTWNSWRVDVSAAGH